MNPDSAAPAPPSPTRALRDGAAFGVWRVTAFLGKGGDGEVYRVVLADDPSVDAALKIHVPDPTKDDAHRRDALARFEREIRFLTEHRRPCFPRYREDGTTNGFRFVIMELLFPIDELPASESAIARFLLSVCGAVRTLHGIGLVHRDIKPRNLMTRRDGTIVLIDLGLVKKAVDPSVHAFAGRTLVNGRPVAAGTYRYSAPEQFEDGDVTAAADVHAIGVIAEECFAGHPPHAWDRIIKKSTCSIPEQRYPTIDALVRAIRRRHAGTWFRAVGALLLAAGLVMSIRFLRSDVRVRELVAWRRLAGAAAYAPADDGTPIHRTTIRLNGGRHAFDLPIRLKPGVEYRIEGPGTLDADLIGGEGTVVRLTRCECIARTRTPPSQAPLRYELHGDVRLNFIALQPPILESDSVAIVEGERNVVEYGGPVSLAPWTDFLDHLP